jgi:hypothetical protein
MVKKALSALMLLALCSGIVAAQSAAEIQQVLPYSKAIQSVPGLTYDQYIKIVNEIAKENASKPRTVAPTVPSYTAPNYTLPSYTAPSYVLPSIGSASNPYLGTLSVNPYLPDSTSNAYGKQGPYGPQSVTNPYSVYGSPYSPTGATNPYATNGPKIVARDGQYLGTLNANPYDPNSIANPYGIYGSPYSPTSINNPYSIYGSQFSPLSPNNPYSTQAPLIIAPRK